METNTKQPKKHIGRNIRRMREMMGIKQDVVADKTGLSQQKISKIEQSENVDDETLEKMAEALGISREAIENFDEEKAVYIVQNSYDNSAASNFNYNCSFNPIDKWVEAIEEIKKLNEKNTNLYEKLLKSEQEKVALLKEQLGKR